jgi:hypothetical protein
MANVKAIAVAAAASIAALSAAYGGEGEASTSRQHPAVACTSEGGSPWIVKARGTLTRTKSKNEIIYDLDLGGHSYTWRFITNPEGSTTIVGPGFLTDRLAGLPNNATKSQSDAGPRGQQLYVTGEIHEYAGATILSLAVGSRCPTRDPKRWTKPTWPPK